MKLCVSLRKLAADIGVHPIEPGESIFNRRNIGILLVFGQNVLSATAGLLFDARRIREFEECSFVWFTVSAVHIAFFVTILRAQTLFELIERLERIIEIYSYDPITKYTFKRTVERIELFTKIIFILFVKVLFPMGVIPMVIVSYYLYFTTDKGSDAFIVLNASKLPWDIKTPIGYAVAVAMQSGTFFIICYAIVCALGMLISFFMLGMSFSQEFRRMLENTEENYKINRDREKVIQDFRTLYSFHCETKEIVGEFNDVTNFIISAVYIWSLLAITDTLLMCHGAENVPDLLLPSVLIFAAFLVIFLFCELGQRIIDVSFDGYDDLTQIAWNRFPLTVQNMFSLFLIGSQDPIVLSGVGSIACTREAFKDVCTGSYSFYSTLKQF